MTTETGSEQSTKRMIPVGGLGTMNAVIGSLGVSVAVIKHKCNLGRKGLISLSSRKPGEELRAGIHGGTAFLVACSASFLVHSTSPAQRGGTDSRGLSAHTLIINPENTFQVCLQANLIPSFLRCI